MRKPLIVFVLIVLISLSQFIVSVPIPRKSLRIQLNPNYLRAIAAYKRLEPKVTRDELRAITTIGILNGARQAEEQMTENLIEIVKDLLENTNINDEQSVIPKIKKIEKQVSRDQHALEVLTNAMDLAVGKFSEKDFRKEMKHMFKAVHRKSNDLADNQETNERNFTESIGNRISALRQNILTEMNIMKELVGEKIDKTLKHIINEADGNGLVAQASEKVIRDKRHAKKNMAYELPAEVRIINSILSEADFRNNLVEDNFSEKRKDTFEDEFELNDLTKKNIENRSDNTSTKRQRPMVQNNNIEDIIKAVVTNITTNRTKDAGRPSKQEIDPSIDNEKPAKQEDGSPEILEDGPDENGGGGGGSGGGGLVGIITSLSGGEGGSDVGALIGALTGVISTLFGPGGLDVDSLISTGTSLIAGLLAGNKNFGTVLGMYVGTAFDGLSGGGGAINNGQFIGNFLGTVVASLSADPDEEDGPIKPLVLAENLINSFLEAKNRKTSGEESGERNDMPHKHSPKDGGSDSGGFVKSIVSHVVSTAISFVLNASLGAVGGASKASSSLVASSSHKTH